MTPKSIDIARPSASTGSAAAGSDTTSELHATIRKSVTVLAGLGTAAVPPDATVRATSPRSKAALLKEYHGALHGKTKAK